jgi:hypothetical protein
VKTKMKDASSTSLRASSRTSSSSASSVVKKSEPTYEPASPDLRATDSGYDEEHEPQKKKVKYQSLTSFRISSIASTSSTSFGTEDYFPDHKYFTPVSSDKEDNNNTATDREDDSGSRSEKELRELSEIDSDCSDVYETESEDGDSADDDEVRTSIAIQSMKCMLTLANRLAMTATCSRQKSYFEQKERKECNRNGPELRVDYETFV